MTPPLGRLSLFSFICILLYSSNGENDLPEKHQPLKLSLGAIVDCSSRAGKEEKVAMEIAMDDFYARVSHRRPTLHVRNSRRDPVRAVSSAKILIKKNQVRAIIGLGSWEEAVFVAELGNKSEVPILSLGNGVPLWASRQWPFLVHASSAQYAQMKAVAAIIQSWQWRRVTVIYEDINSAVTGIVPYLVTALHEAESEINELLPLPPFPSDYSLSEKLEKLKSGQCRVFIVHTSIPLATNLFMQAKKLGMMEKEYVWITTDGIANQLDSINASVISSMQGVLGVKSYFSHSGKRIKDFYSKFRVLFPLQNPNEANPEPGICALRAYDAVWAVALAMEGRTSGKQLLQRILESDFEGLTGEFSFIDGVLDPAHIFRIVNVVGKSYRELGYWSDGLGFSESIGEGVSLYNKSMRILGQVFWPGGPWLVPRGWAIPTSTNQQKIGVPTSTTFKGFVDVSYDHPGGDPIVKGFSIDVFKASLEQLPYNLSYKFVPFDGTYDSLVQQVQLKIFDAVVGDTAIVANRCAYAEFSQPYADSGLQMVVRVNPKRSEKAMLFKKPFTTLMWALTGAINVYNGFVVWFIERQHNPNFRGTVWNQIGTMLSLAFTTLFSLQGEKLHNNLSRMAMVVWLFVALIITQSYTASLTSLLTVERLNPTTVDIETLKKTGAKVGCDGNSFVVKYLQVVLGFDPKNIKKIYSEDDYPQALINGEIVAAFLEVPYVKVFLAKYCNGFTTSGPTFKVGGFGFVFPRGAPVLPDISEAVVKVSESGKLRKLEASLISTFKCSVSSISDDHPNSLGINSFWVLFVITGGTSTVALLLFNFCHVRQNLCFNNQIFSELAPQQQHDPHEDELWMFASEMENQGRLH